jgi:dipeptidyl aminopeptidase/acylaminoacyl peptidase
MAEETELIEQVKKYVIHESAFCPFPGLRPFKYTETHLYFGQDPITQRVLSQLIDHKFVAILGGAGVGKTSFINCGLKPYFYSGIVGSTNTDWHIIHTRPSNNPIRNLAEAINKDEIVENQTEDNSIQAQINYNVLKRGKSGLIELLKQLKPEKKDKYLIIIDQFEDIFRFKNLRNESGLSEDAFEYVNILMHTIQQKEIPVYLTIVVRSDFADDCLRFPYFSNLINRSNVLVPRLTRDQLREVVSGPLETSRLHFDSTLLLQILNDASNLDDLLPRLQHSMRRAWESWKKLATPEKHLSLTEYEIAGGLKNAINNHANELYASLTDDDKILCEKIFKSLAEKGSENKGFTRPTPVKELCGIAQAEFDDVVKIIEVFRDPSAGFLLPSEGIITPDTVIDLVHSSLLRTWSFMKAWVQAENISSQMYRQLSESSAQYQVGKMGLLRPPDLQFALNWQEKQKPSLDWAKRYNPAFERTMVYLRTSLETFNAEESFKKLQAKKALRRVRSLTIILGSMAILTLILTIYSQVMRRQDHKKLKQVSEQQAHLQQKSVDAERESQEYLMEKRQAEIAALEALKEKDEAVIETRVLSQQKTQAELTAQEALQENTKFQENLEQVTLQKQLAERTAQQEAQQRTAAEKEKEEVFKKRMLNIGQTLAVKSLQTNNNATLKGLLALHAYVFNTRFGNSLINPDLYEALYRSVAENGGVTRYGLSGHAGAVKAFSSQPRTNVVYSTGVDGKVLRWVVSDDARQPQTIYQTSGGNASMAISSNGRFLAVGSESGVIYIIDLSNPGNPSQLKGHQGVVFSLTFTPDGQQLFSSGNDKKVLIWELDSKTNTIIYQEPSNVRAISISPDGKFLAGGDDGGRIFLWDIKSSQLTNLANEDKTAIHAIAFSPNGLSLVTGDLSGRIKFWNPYSNRLVRTLQPHSGRVTKIAFSPSGEMVASSSYDKTVAVYDTKFISTIPISLKENSLIFSLIFTNDNKKIITAPNNADFVGVWPAHSRVLAEQLCSKVSRALTQEEWNSFIGADIKYEKPCE